MTAEIVKRYRPRGPLQQVRLAAAEPLPCFRCGRVKKSKLHVVYDGDWNRRLCSGCYGWLLSIYDVKAGTAPDDERADALAELLLQLVDAETAQRAALDGPLLTGLHLSPASERFVGTAEWVAGQLQGQDGLEWSPAAIGLCKAVETEVLRLVVEPWRAACSGRDLSCDESDQHIGRLAKWCSGRATKPPELGTVAYTLRTLARSGRHGTSQLAEGLRQAAEDWHDPVWLTDENGLADAINELAKEHRNRAAHLDALDRDDYESCREHVLGDGGILRRLARSVESR